MRANLCPFLTMGGQASHPHRPREATVVLVHSVDWKWDDERFRDENINETHEKMDVKNDSKARKGRGKELAAGHLSSTLSTDCPLMELLPSQIALYTPTRKNQTTWLTEN